MNSLFEISQNEIAVITSKFKIFMRGQGIARFQFQSVICNEK